VKRKGAKAQIHVCIEQGYHICKSAATCTAPIRHLTVLRENDELGGHLANGASISFTDASSVQPLRTAAPCGVSYTPPSHCGRVPATPRVTIIIVVIIIRIRDVDVSACGTSEVRCAFLRGPRPSGTRFCRARLA